MQTTKQRLLDISGGINFRELGGYPTLDGRAVKWQRVIRTASLARITDTDQQTLLNYGVTVDVDFRSQTEINKEPDRVPTGVRYQHLPVFDDDQTDNSKTQAQIQAELKAQAENGFQHMLDTYHDMITTTQSHIAYQQFFNTLLATEDNVVLFHCTAGKDRTGMGAVFLLNALGVPETTIKQDYLLTNQVAADLVNRRLASAKAEGASGQLLDSIKALWRVSDAYYQTAMTAIHDNYGDMNGFLNQALQLSPQDIADLKALYLSKA